MTTIGMLHYRKHPEKVLKAYAFAAVAKAEGVDFFYFTPGKVNMEKKTILGYALEKGEWIERKMPFPDVIYNAGSPLTEKAYDIHEKLSEQIPFTSHSLGSKTSVYERVKKNGQFSQYLLPFMMIKSMKDVFEFLAAHQNVVIKPVSGHKGIGVIFIEENNGTYTVINQDDTSTYSKQTLRELLNPLVIDEEYLIQRYVSSKTKYGSAYDFRLHVQKNGEGKWVITNIYPRIANPGKIVTNLNSGGAISMLESFLIQEFEEESYNVKRYLEQFSLVFAEHMDKIYDESFDELGIDVGLDANRKIWIYEVNWRPGVPPTFDLELDVARNTIHYAVYLSNKFHGR
ncbi:YheC/YheD family protein [Aneurinibacillus thermoaerophilus]|uniref:YheC/YheD family protein n=2 Tax=Aneurinibacillus thermoaerophilus TaxID=143495 RepID=A0ABX8YGN4_ANETH|nr:MULTISPECIES: YheC/YheD family protein [Aneurinibacillus]AMA73084.1 alpha-L-glutamate ligase [Aneurinibacillus sp. XH2]MED0676559.1 YheC/YheD family protein [Aneurinibacillus thermoaerophilus]MED0757103.1 YheC/YheD family protein [Aneurinibacillus thermoaerophilus]MED0759376.1 YheC/YheD family protein [Aneurinibacillus thermoaerophilus]QYY44374.1 YheC/YheD family protein [Aneurinibacillus thermoaerophilus]